MSNLQRALEIVVSAFSGIVDKQGEPYILHCLRVGIAQQTKEAQIVGVLHDLLEDTDWTRERLESEGFSTDILDSLDSLTRAENEEYFAYINRVNQDPIGRVVKRSDLLDNLKRVGSLALVDRGSAIRLINKYTKALKIIREY